MSASSGLLAAALSDAAVLSAASSAVKLSCSPGAVVFASPEDILNDALQAQNDPQQRKDFFAKSLNVYTAAMKAYFNINEFRQSEREYNWTLKELAKLPIETSFS